MGNTWIWILLGIAWYVIGMSAILYDFWVEFGEIRLSALGLSLYGGFIGIFALIVVIIRRCKIEDKVLIRKKGG